MVPREVVTGQYKCHLYDVISYLACLAGTTVLKNIHQPVRAI